MDYTVLPGTDVKNMDDRYKLLQDGRQYAQDLVSQNDLIERMEKLALEMEARISKDMRKVAKYFDHHANLITRNATQVAAELKAAKALAAQYKSNPKQTELMAQLKRALQKVTDLHREADHDADELGQAWADYRGQLVSHLPEKHREAWHELRASLMNAQKPHALKLEKMVAARREVEALIKWAEKVQSKQAIKKQGAQQRHISDAIQAARELEAEIAQLLQDLRSPGDFAPKPNTVTTSSKQLVEQAGNKQWVQDPKNWKMTLGSWKNVQTGYKLMVTRAATIETVLTTKRKGFRTNELSDPNIKQLLTKAETHVKAAKEAVKTKDADYKAGKKAYEKLEVAFKAASKQKK